MYKKKLKDRISNILRSESNISFEDLCKKSLGAFPFIIHSLLNKEQKQRFSNYLRPTILENKQLLPSENPANYDWRFTEKTNINLFEKIKGKNYRIALFGTPSLYLELFKNNENVHLFDINSILTRYLPQKKNIHIVDLSTHVFNESNEFDCVLMDPPWYSNYYEKWISQANLITKRDGLIYTSLFQELLRPEAKKQRLNIISNLTSIGNIEIHKNFLNYKTPQFEKEVFDYYNIPIYNNWRVADLIKVRNEVKLTKMETLSNMKDTWMRFEINEISISLKNENRSNKIHIKSPYKNGDSLLKSISLRNEIKNEVNLITSQNKGYIVSGTKKLASVLREIEKGLSLEAICEEHNLNKDEFNQVSNFLNTIST